MAKAQIVIKGCGAIMKITPGGNVTNLYKFCSFAGCTDGWIPTAPLVQTSDGNLYGITLAGGGQCADKFEGCGTVFQLTPNGTLTTLYSFCLGDTPCPDGAFHVAFIQGADGDFYGVTSDKAGTVFKITPAGVLTYPAHL